MMQVKEVETMKIRKLEDELTVCKVHSVSDIPLEKEFYFIGRTDEEISLVCRSEDTPKNTAAREDGWKGFRIEGELDFSLIGILSKLSGTSDTMTNWNPEHGNLQATLSD